MFLRGSLITGVLFLAGCAQLGMGNTRGDLQVTEVPAEVREDFTMAEFYQQYCDAGGVPVVASREVYPEALPLEPVSGEPEPGPEAMRRQ